MIKFVKQPQKETGKMLDLFEDQYGEYRYVRGTVTALDDKNEQFNTNGTGYFRGSVAIDGDDQPTRTLNVFSEMMKDVKVGSEILCRVRASFDTKGELYLSVQFSYGESSSQNRLDIETAKSAWGFTKLVAPKGAKTGKKVKVAAPPVEDDDEDDEE